MYSPLRILIRLSLKNKFNFYHRLEAKKGSGDTITISGNIPIDFNLNYFLTLDSELKWKWCIPYPSLKKFESGFDGKLDFRPEPMGEQKDFRSMTEAERQEFFGKMQDMMADMQERMQQMQKAQKEYDKALKEILTKDQFKAYRKDQRKREQEMQRMQQNAMGGAPMGGGFPGGGFPGGPGGGFPGGGFPGGF